MEFTDDCSFFNLFAKKEVLLESSCKTSPPNKKRRQENVPRDYLRIAGDIRRKRCRDPTLCGIKCRAPTKMAPLADRGSLLCGNGAGDVRRQPDSSTARVIHPLCGIQCGAVIRQGYPFAVYSAGQPSTSPQPTKVHPLRLYGVGQPSQDPCPFAVGFALQNLISRQKKRSDVMFVVRKEQCVECGAAFSISLEEFIYKPDNGMKLPKRCKDCRRKNRDHANPYRGIRQIMRQYPATKGHRRKVHGGAL